MIYIDITDSLLIFVNEFMFGKSVLISNMVYIDRYK